MLPPSSGWSMRFEVYTAVKIQVEALWVVTPCSVVVGYQRFGRPCCLYLQGEIWDSRFTRRWKFKSRLYELWRRVELWLDTWGWRQQGPPKWWYPSTTLYGVTTQNNSTWMAGVTSPWGWRQHGPTKRSYPMTTLHGVTTQNMTSVIQVTNNWVKVTFQSDLSLPMFLSLHVMNHSEFPGLRASLFH